MCRHERCAHEDRCRRYVQVRREGPGGAKGRLGSRCGLRIVQMIGRSCNSGALGSSSFGVQPYRCDQTGCGGDWTV